jgi:hypothetical protein
MPVFLKIRDSVSKVFSGLLFKTAGHIANSQLIALTFIINPKMIKRNPITVIYFDLSTCFAYNPIVPIIPNTVASIASILIGIQPEELTNIE